MNLLNKKILGISLICGLLMVGCNKKEEPKTEPNQNSQTTANTAQCDDASIKNSLVRALSVATNEQVGSLMANYPNADGIDLSRRTQQRLGQISLDLQNVRIDGDSCLADMVVVIPTGDLGHAEAYYQSNDKPGITERSVSQSLTIEQGRISTPVRYTIKEGRAVLTDTPRALALIADIMSASAYHMAQDESRLNTNARPAVNVQPLEPIEVTRPNPVVREPNLNESQASNSSDTDTSSDTNTEASNAASNEASTSRATPSTPPVEGEGELTIVESNETY